MLKRLTPFFDADGELSAGSDTSGDWMSIAQNAMTEETPVDDVQPETDTDTETLETAEEQTGDETQESDPETPTEPSFNDETEIDLGEGRQPVKLAELKQGYLRQSDYTKKTQELSAQRKEMETMQEQLGPTKDWLDHMTTNPWLWQQINSAIQEFHNTGALPIEEVLADAQYGQYVNHLMAENARLQKQLESLNGEYEGVKLSAEMTRLQNDLKAEYGDLVTDDYMNTLQERGKTEKLSAATLREIADGHLSKQKLQQAEKEVKTAPKKAAAKAVQELAETRRSMPPQPGTHAQVPGQEEPDLHSMDWMAAAKYAGQLSKR